MRRVLLSAVLMTSLSAAGTVPLLAASSAAVLPDGSLLTEHFSVDGDTAVPGAVLKSGSYTIRVVDHLSDRSIIRVEKADGKTVTTFLAIPNRSLASSGSQGPVIWDGGSNHNKALRGFNFPGAFSVEFVYPKAEAVKIATTHSASVEAIDPSSDNLPSKQKSLTDDDMRIVTLWTLTPTTVNGSTAIAAAKYKSTETAPASEPVVARNEPPAGLPAPTSAAPAAPPVRSTAAAPTRSKAAAPAPKPVARRPVTAALPHTASPLPTVLLAGLVSLFGIVTLRTRKLVMGR